MPDRRQVERRQGDRRETPEKKKSISLSVFMITIFTLIIIFIVSLICIILSYQKTISELENNQVTDLTLIPGIYDTPNDDTTSIENLTLVE